MDDHFRLVHATGSSSQDLLSNLISQSDAKNFRAKLGFVYVTDLLTNELDLVMQNLREHFHVENWVGTVGVGICCTGVEYYDEHAIVILLARDLAHQLFEIPEELPDQMNFPLPVNPAQSSLAVIHGNPMHKNLMNSFTWLCEQLPSTYFVGGLSSSNTNPPQIFNQLIDASFSGVLLEDSSAQVVGHTQGCEPINQSHTITRAKDNMVIQLDGRPALDVLKEEVGEVLSRDLKQIAGYIFAGFPIEHSDTNDYLVRNIIGFDLDQASIFIGDYIQEGSQMMFCRRDGNSAIADMHRMLEEMKSRLEKPAKAALYYSCLARGRNQFGNNSEELAIIQQHLGDIPLVGFFANGEILHNRLYGYTGVLTLFT